MTAAGDRLDCSCTTRELGPSPLPTLAAYPLGRTAPVRGRRDRSGGAHPARVARVAARTGPDVVVLSSDAAVEAYPGWVGTARRRQRWTTSRPSSRSSSRICACTRSTPATCAPRSPGRLPGRGHLHRADPATVVPALLRLSTNVPGAAVPRGGPAGDPPMTPHPTHDPTADGLHPAARAGRDRAARSSAGWPATRCGCSSPQPTGGPARPVPRPRRVPPPGDLVVVNTSATRAAAVDGWRADGRRSPCTSPTRYRTEVTGRGVRSPGGPRRCGTRVPARCSGCPAG